MIPLIIGPLTQQIHSLVNLLVRFEHLVCGFPELGEPFVDLLGVTIINDVKHWDEERKKKEESEEKETRKKQDFRNKRKKKKKERGKKKGKKRNPLLSKMERKRQQQAYHMRNARRR